MNRTTIFVCAAAIAFGSGTAALAVPAKTPIYDWTGTYAGVNLGGATGSSDLKTSVGESNYFDTDNIAPFNGTGSTTVHPSGFVGGGQIGYNKQTDHIVYGIEGDFDALDLSASKGKTATYFDNADQYTINQSTKTTWLATVRPRVGYANGNSLVYATAGVAFTDVSAHASFSDGFDGVESASKKSTETGYVLGAGVAYALQGNWSISGEYLYANFGKVSYSGVIGGPDVSEFPGTLNHSANLSANLFRVALNYKF